MNSAPEAERMLGGSNMYAHQLSTVAVPVRAPLWRML